jgi:hydroxypyruvate reductase
VKTARQILACGAEIAEINCIPKHLLLLAGDRRARRIAVATSTGIVLSDVVGDDFPTVASGPTSPDAYYVLPPKR